jgi:ABC-type transport system involved in cytochrome bd biosynthesis fused ATPase/permease subunit
MSEPESPKLEEEPYVETPEQLQARQQRANRATRGALAGVLCLEAFVVLLMPRALAQTSGGLGTTKTVILIALAVVMVMCGFLLRRRWGMGTGTGLQVVYLLTGIWLPVSLIASIILVGTWLYLLNLRSQIAGTPGGARMLIS